MKSKLADFLVVCISIGCTFAGGYWGGVTFGKILAIIIFGIVGFLSGAILGGLVYALFGVVPERAISENKRIEKEQDKEKEGEQWSLAHEEGLEKYYRMKNDEVEKYHKAADAMREIGRMMNSSVYQEKERDWGVWAGIADGLAGPGAGVATAIDIMNDNERIREENAARREWAAKEKEYFYEMADETEENAPSYISMEQLKRQYKAIMAWSPKTLFSYLTIEDKNVKVDDETGTATVTVNWRKKVKELCIDGALRAKLYNKQGACVGCAYLVFPKEGTYQSWGSLSGICTDLEPFTEYTVKIEPVDLWELAPKDKNISKKCDNLTIEEHRKIVEEYKENYEKELEQ